MRIAIRTPFIWRTIMNPIELPRVNDRERVPDVELRDAAFAYRQPDADSVQALSGVSLTLQRGTYSVLLGRNGSGKSTMAKLINVLEIPGSGTVLVMGKETTNEAYFWDIRRSCGMVFQNPDNQIVGTIVEEDVAFGPENLGIPTQEIRRRVDESLLRVGMSEFAMRQPSQLSGGQKQKVAIAGILAMQPQILLLDESTSMLDPVSRDDFLSVVENLVRETGMTLLHITHDMSEACRADQVFVLDHGRLALSGSPGEVFSQVERIQSLGLEVPVFADIVYRMAERLGYTLTREDLTSRDAALKAARSMCALVNTVSDEVSSVLQNAQKDELSSREVLRVSNLAFSYEKNGEKILSDISFSVRKGEIFAIIGHSGSGKTTLISHINGLIRPQEGEVLVFPDETGSGLSTKLNKDIKKIRRSVGLLFQYPEYQLFEETVEKDIAFGPKKMGLTPEEIEKRIVESLELVGLDSSFRTRSPFELSGGQKRRVAFAGVLAMDPDVLVLDEPAAGLDPIGRKEIFHYAEVLKEKGKTVIIVSHNMDEAARYADRILVLRHGRICALDQPHILFSDAKKLSEIRITAPETISFLSEMKTDYEDIEARYFRPKEAACEIIRAAAQKNQLGMNSIPKEGGTAE